MAVYKDKNGTWYVSARYDNWQGDEPSSMYAFPYIRSENPVL